MKDDDQFIDGSGSGRAASRYALVTIALTLAICSAIYAVGYRAGYKAAAVALDWSDLQVPPEPDHSHLEAHGHEHPRSGKWPAVRAAYLREHPACEACGSTKDLNVHHCKSFAAYPELELSEANLLTLCRDDHFLLGHARSWTHWNPHVREDAALMLERIKHRKEAHER